MGIQGLLPLLKSIQKPCNLAKFTGQTVGVDAYGWLHRGTIACTMELTLGKPTMKFVDFAMHRVRMLQHFGVTPFLVFDGDYLPSKAATEASRAKKREESKKLGLELLYAGKTADAYLELRKAIDVTPDMARQLIDELKKVGVQYIVAPYEADAQLVYLERLGLISAMISEDSDLLVFGAKCLLTKLDKYGNCIEINKNDFCACRDVNLTGWSDTEFRCMAILSGCDYLDGISNIGLKNAHRLVRKYKTIEKVLRALQFEGKYHIPSGYLEAFHQAELTFLHQRVFNPISNMLVFHTEPGQPLDEEKMLFIGAYVEPEVARRVATGEINPMTKQPIVIRPGHTANTSSTPWMTSKPQLRRSATAVDLKKGVSIQEFFKPHKRIPLGELDPNCFTPSPTQQIALLRNPGSWAAESVPRQYLRQSNTDTQTRVPQSVPTRTGGRTPASLSESRPQKRTRLCADDIILDKPAKGLQLDLGRSPFFDSPAMDLSPSIGRSSKSKRSKKDDIMIYSDDSIEEALLSLPDFDSWRKPDSKNCSSITAFDDAEVKPESDSQSPKADGAVDGSQICCAAEVSQITAPSLTQSSNISSADETPTPVDGEVAVTFNSLKEKFSFTPAQDSSLRPVNELATPPSSLRFSRIPRAVKHPAAAILSAKSTQTRGLTPLQSLGAKAMNRSSVLLPSPPFTPKSVSPTTLPKPKLAPTLKNTSSSIAPFPEVTRPSMLQNSVELDPLEIPLPIPDKDELLNFSTSVADKVGSRILPTTVIEGKGSEDLIIHDSEEELEEISSPTKSLGELQKLGLDRFTFRG